MFGFKSKKFVKQEKHEEEKTQPPVPSDEVEPEPSPVPTPIDLPLDGTVPDPPETDEPDPVEAAAPMLDFSTSAAGGNEQAGGDDSSSLADLFSGTEEQAESSLGPILDMAPQATIEDVMEDLFEIKEMLRGRLNEEY